MNQNPLEKLDEIITHSAWTFDETLELLTGTTSTHIEISEQRVPRPVPDIRRVLMLETRTITWNPGREPGNETDGGQRFYTKGNVEYLSERQAKHFIDNRCAQYSESSGERENRIKNEEDKYQQAQHQCTLLKMLKRAILDHDIESVNDVDRYPIQQWRLKRESVLQWANNNWDEVSSLRHFPNDAQDVLIGLLKEWSPAREDGEKTRKKRGPTPEINWDDVKKVAKAEALAIKDGKKKYKTKIDVIKSRAVRRAMNPKLADDLLEDNPTEKKFKEETGAPFGTARKYLSPEIP